MEELKDLEKIHQLAIERFDKYDGKDFILPNSFKEKVKEINSSTITYNKYSAIIQTRGNQNGILNIFLPNQWFYIASYFTELYNELQKYKKTALKAISKERLKVLNGAELTNEEKNAIKQLNIDKISEERLVKFITDYTWWSGAKTIDRGDFYVSPVLNSAKLLNASQSFVAELCAFLSDKTELVKIIISGEEQTHLEKYLPLQQIFYGAPGTGKSNTIKREVDDKNQICFRTTFHPDSDYSTFVGCYKPSMKRAERLLSYSELIDRLSTIRNQGHSFPCHKFAAKYWESVKQLSRNEIKEILDACEIPESMVTEIAKGVAVGEELSKHNRDAKIVYTYTPQAFLKAYVKAWQTPEKPVFLIIEEINRGNCAQIFGDLFQLLDRKNGVSEYPINADQDMQQYLQEVFASYTELPEHIRNGEILQLPANLYIWATMNTSDQSLFPIDSAFKRRWDWKYTPIADGRKGWTIETNGNRYDWWEFIQKINDEIGSTTNSEDKKLGYFFCKAEDGIIDADKFVSKVIFYLWNDVFKDIIEDGGNLFRDTEGKTLSFDKFYTVGYNGSAMVVEDNVDLFLKNLGIEPLLSDIMSSDEIVTTSSVIKINGMEIKRINAIPYTTIEEYVRLNENMSAQEVIDIWSPFKKYSTHSWIVANKEELDNMKPRYANYSYKIDCKDGTSLWVNKDGWMHHPANPGYRDTIKEFIDAVNEASLGITITEEPV